MPMIAIDATETVTNTVGRGSEVDGLGERVINLYRGGIDKKSQQNRVTLENTN